MSFDCVECEPAVARVSAEIKQETLQTQRRGRAPQATFDQRPSLTPGRESVEEGEQDSGDYPVLGPLLSHLESLFPSPIIRVPEMKAVLRIKSTPCQFPPPNRPEEALYLSETTETSSK